MVDHIGATGIFHIGKEYIAPDTRSGKRRKSSLALSLVGEDARQTHVEDSAGSHYALCACSDILPALKRIGFFAVGILVSITAAMQRTASVGGSLHGNGDLASYIFVVLRTFAYILVTMVGLLMLDAGRSKIYYCFKLVTALLALPTEKLDRTRRQRLWLSSDIDRMPLTKGTAVDAFMSLRKVVLAEIRTMIVSETSASIVLTVGCILQLLPYIM